MLATIPAVINFLQLLIIGDMLFPSLKDKTGPGRLIGFVSPKLVKQMYTNTAVFSIAEEVVRKRYKEDPTGTEMDIMAPLCVTVLAHMTPSLKVSCKCM
jgi:hypothetical protein